MGLQQNLAVEKNKISIDKMLSGNNVKYSFNQCSIMALKGFNFLLSLLVVASKKLIVYKD